MLGRVAVSERLSRRGKLAALARCGYERFRDFLHAGTAGRRPEMDARVLQALRKDGFFVLRAWLPRPTCLRAADELRRVVATNSDLLEVDPQKSDHRFWAYERLAEFGRTFHHAQDLLGWAEAYLGTPTDNLLTLAGCLLAQPGNLGSGGGWHRDSIFERQFKAMIYLCDVQDDNGPFQFFPGSHRLGYVLETLDYTPAHQPTTFTDEDIQRWIRDRRLAPATITGSPGDCILADTRGLHRGMPIRQGSRLALTNYYVARHRRRDFEVYFASRISRVVAGRPDHWTEAGAPHGPS